MEGGKEKEGGLKTVKSTLRYVFQASLFCFLLFTRMPFFFSFLFFALGCLFPRKKNRIEIIHILYSKAVCILVCLHWFAPNATFCVCLVFYFDFLVCLRDNDIFGARSCSENGKLPQPFFNCPQTSGVVGESKMTRDDVDVAILPLAVVECHSFLFLHLVDQRYRDYSPLS